MTSPDPTAHIRAELVMRRALAGLSGYELAERMGVTQGAVSQLERGASSRTQVDTWVRWAVALDCTLDIRLIPIGDVLDGAADRIRLATRTDPDVPWAVLAHSAKERWRALARAALGWPA